MESGYRRTDIFGDYGSADHQWQDGIHGAQPLLGTEALVGTTSQLSAFLVSIYRLLKDKKFSIRKKSEDNEGILEKNRDLRSLPFGSRLQHGNCPKYYAALKKKMQIGTSCL